MSFSWGKFSPKGLQSIRESTARLNIYEGAVRSGKTICSIVRWLEYIGTGPPGDLLMVGKTERTLKRNILDPMEQVVGRKRFKYNRGLGEVYIYGRRIYVAGANDERSEGKIRGMTLAGAYGDELTLWPESFFKMLLSRLSVSGAKLFGTTNPDSPYHWLKVDYLDKDDLDLASWHFELEDNINLDPAYVEALKKEYTGLWYKRFILGLWVLAEGAIYDMWDDQVHAVDVIPNRFSRFYLGVDYGTGNPTVFLLIGKTGKTFYVLDEYYYDSTKTGRQKTDAEYSQDLQNFLGNNRPEIFIDPSAASFITQLQRDGVGAVVHADNAVIDGIRNVANALSNGRLFVYRKKCPNLLREFSSYVWDPKAQQKGEDKPLKKNDHACLVAGTMVETDTGAKPIEGIIPGEYVLTRQGYRRVLLSGKTAQNVTVKRIDFSNDQSITGTDNHPVWVKGCGWVPIGNLKEGDELIACQPILLPSKVLNSGNTRRLKTGAAAFILCRGLQTKCVALAGFMKKFGRLPMGLSPQAAISIIKTGIQRTTNSKILSAFLLRFIYLITAMIRGKQLYIRKISRTLLLLLLSGIGRRKAGDGMASMGAKFGRSAKPLSWFANSVVKSMKHLAVMGMKGFALITADHSGGVRQDWITKDVSVPSAEPVLRSINTLKPKPADVPAVFVCGIKGAGKANVYNLSVSGVHEYFANGVLVSNCDALRYVIHTLGESAPLPEETKRLFKGTSLYG